MFTNLNLGLVGRQGGHISEKETWRNWERKEGEGGEEKSPMKGKLKWSKKGPPTRKSNRSNWPHGKTSKRWINLRLVIVVGLFIQREEGMSGWRELVKGKLCRIAGEASRAPKRIWRIKGKGTLN
jgi:hypothetical protein